MNREDFPILSQLIYKRPLVYLDNAATTQKPQCVIDAISEMYSCVNANVHRGVHYLSQKATDRHEAAREVVRQFINARTTAEIIFTRGTTESINLVASSFGEAFLREGDEVIVSTMEHHSNIVPWQLLRDRKGIVLKVIPITDEGCLDMEAYKTGIYKCNVPAGYDKMIFVRFNPEGSTSDWNNKWGQTEDLSVPVDEKVCYVLNAGFWDKEGGQSGGSWQEYTPGTEPENPDTPDTPDTPDNPETKEVRIYIQHNWDWNYGLWCWLSDDSQIFTGNQWPGKRPDGVETKDGKTYSYWTVPAEHVGKTVSLLITDAKDDWSSHDQQTSDYKDVTLSESVYFYFDYIDNENRLVKM